MSSSLAARRHHVLAGSKALIKAAQRDAGLEVDVLRIEFDAAAGLDLEDDIQQARRIDQPDLEEAGRGIDSASERRTRACRKHRQNGAADDARSCSWAQPSAFWRQCGQGFVVGLAVGVERPIGDLENVARHHVSWAMSRDSRSTISVALFSDPATKPTRPLARPPSPIGHGTAADRVRSRGDAHRVLDFHEFDAVAADLWPDDRSVRGKQVRARWS